MVIFYKGLVMRFAASVLLIITGCSSVLPESADAKAIKAYIRDSSGDGVDIPKITIVESGKCGEYEVNPLLFEPEAELGVAFQVVERSIEQLLELLEGEVGGFHA